MERNKEIERVLVREYKDNLAKENRAYEKWNQMFEKWDNSSLWTHALGREVEEALEDFENAQKTTNLTARELIRQLLDTNVLEG